MTEPAANHIDVLIIGAGISGIGAACRLTDKRPGMSYAILERREQLGGTWDLFRYPGVRSDSDMLTFGYDFRPWDGAKVLADGESIRDYVNATAVEYGVVDHIRFGRKVVRAAWDTEAGTWTVDVTREDGSGVETWTATFLLCCTGYYDYDSGYRPDFPGEERFAGTLVHPQHWPADLDHTGKRVVVIGSGATAITLVPAMAEDAASVTMLQRSPSYIASVPAEDPLSVALRRVLPDKLVLRAARGRNIAIQRAMYELARAFPGTLRKVLLAGVRRQLRPDFDMRHFEPSYEPWDQRLCIVPNGDLFRTLRNADAEIVTDAIDTFTESGIRLVSGRELDADIVVTATGLSVAMLGGAELEVDGEVVRVNELLTYKGVLLESVPNAAVVFGYTNASWTLKVDIACEYVCRLLAYLDEHGYDQFRVPAAAADARTDRSMLSSLNAGYVRRGDSQLPRQGTRGPWKIRNDYLRDAPTLRHSRIDDGVLRFSRTRRLPRTNPQVEQQPIPIPKASSA